MPEILCVGLTTVDIIYFGASVPRMGTKTEAAASSIDVGGPAANAAIAAADLGAHVGLCSAVGNGPFAQIARSELLAEGVDLLDCELVGQLPISSVFIDANGERSVVSTRGGTATPTTPRGLSDAAASAKVVLVDGHYPDLALTALTTARARGITTIIDLGSWKPALPSLLPYCDFSIASADFAAPGGDVFDAVLSFGGSWVAVSNGAQPIVWRARDGSTGAVAVPAVHVEATNGAGDVLHGAFAHFLADGTSPVPALTMAAKLASASCTNRSARIPAAATAAAHNNADGETS